MTKKLTPQEAWELHRSINSNVVGIQHVCDQFYHVVWDDGEKTEYWADIDWGDLTQWPPKEPENYMLEALCSALNVLEKGIEVRIQDSWPALKAMLPETIRKVKDAIERAEADLGAQKQPSSVAKIQAETKAVARALENVGGSEQVLTGSLVARFCELRYPELDQEMILQTLAGLLMQDLEIWKQLIQHPADREPTDEEVERAALIYDPQINGYGQEFACFKAKDDVKCALKAWQQVWREQE